MKLKNIIFFAGLFILAMGSTAFVSQPVEENPTEAKASFPKFLSYFEKVDLPFKIDLGELHKYQAPAKSLKRQKKKSSTTNILPLPELREFVSEHKLGGISRMGPPKIMPVARFYPNEKMIAVVYGVYNSFGMRKNMNFKMALYDLKGNFMYTQKENEFWNPNSFPLAQVSSGKTETFELDASNHIWKKVYKNVFKKDEKIHGFIDNEIIGYTLEDTQVFKINDKGVVETVKEYPISDKASLD